MLNFRRIWSRKINEVQIRPARILAPWYGRFAEAHVALATARGFCVGGSASRLAPKVWTLDLNLRGFPLPVTDSRHGWNVVRTATGSGIA